MHFQMNKTNAPLNSSKKINLKQDKLRLNKFINLIYSFLIFWLKKHNGIKLFEVFLTALRIFFGLKCIPKVCNELEAPTFRCLNNSFSVAGPLTRDCMHILRRCVCICAGACVCGGASFGCVCARQLVCSLIASRSETANLSPGYVVVVLNCAPGMAKSAGVVFAVANSIIHSLKPYLHFFACVYSI